MLKIQISKSRSSYLHLLNKADPRSNNKNYGGSCGTKYFNFPIGSGASYLKFLLVKHKTSHKFRWSIKRWYDYRTKIEFTMLY